MTIYNPQPVSTDNIKRDVEREHHSIRLAIGSINEKLATEVTTLEPQGSNRPDDPLFGFIRYADGVTWNPLNDGEPGFVIKGTKGWLRIAID